MKSAFLHDSLWSGYILGSKNKYSITIIDWKKFHIEGYPFYYQKKILQKYCEMLGIDYKNINGYSLRILRDLGLKLDQFPYERTNINL